MDVITSHQNPIVKEIKALNTKKYREEMGMFFIEGIRFVQEALNEKAEVVRILVSESLSQVRGGSGILSGIRAGGYDTCVLSDRIFKEISDTESPQGIMAVIKVKAYDLDEMLDKSNFLILLDSVQDPGNMGTIIRTADAAGATGVIISKGCVDLYNPKVLRSTMGSIFHVPVSFCDSLPDTIDKLKSSGIKVLAAHLKGLSNYFDMDMKDDVAIIIGNEANGISEETASKASTLVKIPMPGRAESLNASMAAGLLMYEVVRQRQKT